jgi:Kef-type K+ transport system membrane component KefB
VSSGGDGSMPVSVLDILWIVGKVVIFFAITLFMGLVAFPEKTPLVLPQNPSFYQRVDYQFSRAMTTMGARRFLMVHQGEFTPLIMLLIALFLGFIAFELGFHPAIGAYFAGLFLHADYFVHIKTKWVRNAEGGVVLEKEHDHQFDSAANVINHLAFTIFGPIFFVNLGGKLIFDAEVVMQAMPMALSLYAAVVILQILSAGLAARFTGSYKWHESVMIGLGMLGRAELAFIVINIAFVQNSVINNTEFYTLMITAFMLNLTVPLSLKWWKPYYLGFKQFKLFGITFSRPQPAPVPKGWHEYKEMMEEERRRYLPDS